MISSRRCWADIDLGALRHNLSAVRRRAGARVRVMAVVKSDAYGHGLDTVARELAGQVEMLGVADVHEALRLRRYVAPGRVLILGPALPEEREEIARRGFVPTVSTLEEAEAYERLHRGRSAAGMRASGMDEPMQIHLDIDTGMGRIGVWQDDAESVVSELLRMPGLIVSGLSTHLPVADEDAAYTADQLRRFEQCVENLARAGLRVPVTHALNSAGTIRFSQHAGDMVRTGLALYGSSPIPDFQPQLRPVMSWRTRVTLVRELGAGRSISYGRTYITPRPMRVATLGAGYGDGYPRHLSGRGAEVLVGGRRCALLGRVTMDQIMVDVTGVPGVKDGDEAVLMGRQGGEEVLAAELAGKAGTIPWEIFTRVSKRVVRI